MLKLKAFIYQTTGIFLASREQLDYVDSDEFWAFFQKELQEQMWQEEHRFYGPRFIYGILVGSWQMKHGFVRGLWLTRMGKEGLLWDLAEWVVLFLRGLKNAIM